MLIDFDPLGAGQSVRAPKPRKHLLVPLLQVALVQARLSEECSELLVGKRSRLEHDGKPLFYWTVWALKVMEWLIDGFYRPPIGVTPESVANRRQGLSQAPPPSYATTFLTPGLTVARRPEGNSTPRFPFGGFGLPPYGA